jgi:hypothetical protein
MAEKKPVLSFDDALAAVTDKPADAATLSFDEALKAIESEPTPPSAGYWEDRGIGGKVWHPASGVREGNRSDNQVLGMPPELAALSALGVGRAVLTPGLNAVGRVIAGAKATAGQAAPYIGSEVVRHGLKAVGVPEPFASVGADLVLARTLRGKGAARAATTEAKVAAEEMTPMGFPKPTAAAETPLEFSRRLKAEHQAKSIPPFGPARPVKVDPEAFGREFKQLAKKPKLTAEEMLIGAKELQSGKTAEQVWDMLLKRRELPIAFKALPTDAEMLESLVQRNTTGKWPQP